MDIIALITIAAAVLLIQAWIFKYAFRRLEYDCRFSTSEAYEGDK